jgi:hypothetical protein
MEQYFKDVSLQLELKIDVPNKSLLNIENLKIKELQKIMEDSASKTPSKRRDSDSNSYDR